MSKNAPPPKRVADAKRALEAAELVSEAAFWAHELARSESRGPGDFLDAMHRVADKFEIAYATLWNLRYRTPPSIGVESYIAIFRAYAATAQNAEAKTKVGAALLSIAGEIGKAA